MKRLLQLKSHKNKLEFMEKNIEDVVIKVKNEIATSAKRDAHLVDRKDR